MPLGCGSIEFALFLRGIVERSLWPWGTEDVSCPMRQSESGNETKKESSLGTRLTRVPRLTGNETTDYASHAQISRVVDRAVMAKAVVPSQQNVVPSGTSQQGAAEASAVATFISKVWKIVEKTEHNPLISWTVVSLSAHL